MSITYTPTTNFGSKDTLPANDPNKVIVGAEFTTEFASIQAAFAAAAPTSNPTFSGTSTFGVLNAGTTTVGTFTSTGIDDNATSTALTIASSGDVGIGQTNPAYVLDLKDSTPIINMEHAAGGGSRIYFSDATDGGWGGIKARYASGGSVKEIAIAPASATGDARYGGLSVTPTKATIGGDFQQTDLEVVGLVSVAGTYPAVQSRTPGSLGSRFVTTGSNMLMASLTSAGAYASDIYKVGLSETGPIKHTWTTTTAGSAMVLLDGGNLGLGTTAPGTALDVVGSGKSIRTRDTGANACTATMVSSSTSAYLQVARNSGANTSRAELTARGNQADLELENNNGYVAKIEHQSTGEFSFTMDDDAFARMTFNTGTAEAMRITQAGNVGIGTDAPQTKLHVTQSAEDGSDGIRLSRSNGLGTFTQWVSSASAWSLGYSNPATTDPTTAAMTVLNTGAVVIGKTDASTNVNGLQFDTLTGCGRIIASKSESGTRDSLMNYHNFTYVGGVRYTDTATSFPTSSDERLKDNIVDAPAGNIDDLKVRSFDWKANGEHQEYGFVAQELEPVAPYAVSSCGTEDAMLAVDYSKLVPMLVKEIQDLKARVLELEGA